jgi:hypothetical protein
MQRNVLIRPLATSSPQLHPATSRRTVFGVPFGGLLFGVGLVVACLGLAGVIGSFFQAEESGVRLANAGPWSLFALLGMTVVWRYKRSRVVDRLKPCREMLDMMRSVHCEPLTSLAARDERLNRM